MIQKIISFLILSIILIWGCKKQDETNTNVTSNISSAPTDITQSFNIEVTIENKKVAEIIKRNGVTEFSKTTYKYTTDTIFETLYELGRRSFLRKHRIDNEVITSSLDSAFGKDTTIYYRFVNYDYKDGKIQSTVITHKDILELITKTTTIRYDYISKEGNLFEVGYDAQNSFDSTQCNDQFEYYNYETILDMKNILGINGSGFNKNLVSKSAHLIHCNTNGATGSTSYEYWYALDKDKRITELVYRKTFNGIAQTFKENYKYVIR